MPSFIDSIFSLSGRQAVVTGGTSGIGKMIAMGLLAAGSSVIITGRNAENCEAVVDELSEFGECTFALADLSHDDQLKRFADRVAQKAPRLSILVNNAGMSEHAPFGKYTGAQFDRVLQLNLKAPFLLSQCLSGLLKSNASQETPAHIINVSSIASMVATAMDAFAYNPSKAALNMVTRNLSELLASDFVLVNAIAPGVFPSRMTANMIEEPTVADQLLKAIPIGRFGQPKDIAALAVMIASSSYMTGAVIPIDGGLSVR